ncbi:mannitol dehydrogenase family protein [Roseobacter sp. N2S]|uniref:mannitol dehydrogenase family protein n=1 Tax=Roseobacter sp. N2S TaxID=2663844 RepID=UPI0028651EE6|nr:mannitol dehydrogenase family protein [Roseobacter sp. N2S]MDR6265652.1 mannitol 2-dehydrogenase [Roseobacter sp. N2S]
MDELKLLSNATLGQLADEVRVPRYDRSTLKPGIVHIGLGNFHRAHQAWYLHRLFDAGLNHDWAIIGAGVRAGDAVQREKLLAQDCLTTLIELDPSGKSAEVCGAMIDFLPVEPDNAALITQMADPAIRIVSLTVTEGGYFIDPATGGFATNHADIQHDSTHPDQPCTAFGAIIAALKLRRDAGTGPFTCMSCDNLQGNGAVLRQTVVSLAKLSDATLAAWIEENCSFPDSMVDCIVPATGPSEIALANGFGINDAAPVTHENFRQWVIEDAFCAGRPDWEKAGATLTSDVHDYETMKIRILNGGHQIIAGTGAILGLETIAQTMAYPAIRALLRKVVTEEIAPHVAPVPDCTPLEYLDLIDSRFSNPEIADTTRRVAFDGSSRHPGFIVPSIRNGLKAGTPIEGLALVSAAWARYCLGSREDGSEIAPNDPHWDLLTATAQAAKIDPAHWLGMTQFYGNLAQDTRFASAFAKWLTKIHAGGLDAAMADYLDA